MERRQGKFISGAAALLFAACSPLPGPEFANISPVTVTANLQEALSRYPEFKDYRLKGGGEFSTQSSTTRWFNFSRASFNEKRAKEIIEYFEKLGQKGGQIQYLTSEDLQQVHFSQHPATERTIFILEEDMPKPSGADQTRPAGTLFDGKDFIEFYLEISQKDGFDFSFGSIEPIINAFFNVEACNSSIRLVTSENDFDLVGQEVVCSSFGLALTLKQLGFSFREYLNWVSTHSMRINHDGPIYNFWSLNAREYQEIPKTGFALTVRKNK